MEEEQFVPTEFGRYHLVEKLAKGGMAEIFMAKSHGAHGFEKTLVVKRILPQLASDLEFVERNSFLSKQVLIQNSGSGVRPRQGLMGNLFNKENLWHECFPERVSKHK